MTERDVTPLTLVRNATIVLQLDDTVVLVDPMLNAAGRVPPVEDTAPAQRNPLVELPFAAERLANAGVVLVTHLHNDHFDAAARRLLPADVPLLCQPVDAERLAGDGFTALTPVESRA